jgi:hypothetical protein
MFPQPRKGVSRGKLTEAELAELTREPMAVDEHDPFQMVSSVHRPRRMSIEATQDSTQDSNRGNTQESWLSSMNEDEIPIAAETREDSLTMNDNINVFFLGHGDYPKGRNMKSFVFGVKGGPTQYISSITTISSPGKSSTVEVASLMMDQLLSPREFHDKYSGRKVYYLQADKEVRSVQIAIDTRMAGNEIINLEMGFEELPLAGKDMGVFGIEADGSKHSLGIDYQNIYQKYESEARVKTPKTVFLPDRNSYPRHMLSKTTNYIFMEISSGPGVVSKRVMLLRLKKLLEIINTRLVSPANIMICSCRSGNWKKQVNTLISQANILRDGNPHQPWFGANQRTAARREALADNEVFGAFSGMSVSSIPHSDSAPLGTGNVNGFFSFERDFVNRSLEIYKTIQDPENVEAPQTKAGIDALKHLASTYKNEGIQRVDPEFAMIRNAMNPSVFLLEHHPHSEHEPMELAVIDDGSDSTNDDDVDVDLSEALSHSTQGEGVEDDIEHSDSDRSILDAAENLDHANDVEGEGDAEGDGVIDRNSQGSQGSIETDPGDSMLTGGRKRTKRRKGLQKGKRKTIRRKNSQRRMKKRATKKSRKRLRNTKRH